MNDNNVQKLQMYVPSIAKLVEQKTVVEMPALIHRLLVQIQDLILK